MRRWRIGTFVQMALIAFLPLASVAPAGQKSNDGRSAGYFVTVVCNDLGYQGVEWVSSAVAVSDSSTVAHIDVERQALDEWRQAVSGAFGSSCNNPWATAHRFADLATAEDARRHLLANPPRYPPIKLLPFSFEYYAKH